MIRDNLKDKELALLQATLTLVNHQGFHAASMSKIAQMAGISPGTIYLYFENKQDMLDKLYIIIKSEMCEYAFMKHNPQGGVVEEFKNIWYRIADYKISHIKEAMFLANCDITPVVTESSKKKALEFLNPLLDVWRRGQEEGIIRNISLHLIYAFSVNPLSYLIFSKVDKKIKLTQKQTDEAYEMAWKAIEA